MTLYVTDDELIERLGVPEKIARDALRVLDHDPASGFPKKQKLWGDRRYWPAVQDYLDLRYRPRRRVEDQSRPPRYDLPALAVLGRPRG